MKVLFFLFWRKIWAHSTVIRTAVWSCEPDRHWLFLLLSKWLIVSDSSAPVFSQRRQQVLCVSAATRYSRLMQSYLKYCCFSSGWSISSLFKHATADLRIVKQAGMQRNIHTQQDADKSPTHITRFIYILFLLNSVLVKSCSGKLSPLFIYRTKTHHLGSKEGELYLSVASPLQISPLKPWILLG